MFLNNTHTHTHTHTHTLSLSLSLSLRSHNLKMKTSKRNAFYVVYCSQLIISKIYEHCRVVDNVKTFIVQINIFGCHVLGAMGATRLCHSRSPLHSLTLRDTVMSAKWNLLQDRNEERSFRKEKCMCVCGEQNK